MISKGYKFPGAFLPNLIAFYLLILYYPSNHQEYKCCQPHNNPPSIGLELVSGEHVIIGIFYCVHTEGSGQICA